jgi:hypothetical protein
VRFQVSRRNLKSLRAKCVSVASAAAAGLEPASGGALLNAAHVLLAGAREVGGGHRGVGEFAPIVRSDASTAGGAKRNEGEDDEDTHCPWM